MAEDRTTTGSKTGAPPLVVTDGASNTVVLEEDAPERELKPADGADATNGSGEGVPVIIVGGEPPASPAQPPIDSSETNETGIFATRDPQTGEVTLGVGASIGGTGPITVPGTDLVFEDQDEFEQFLADVNAKAAAGVPIEDILGANANAIPVIENGEFTGETLGDIEDGAAADTAPGGFSPGDGGNFTGRDRGADPDSDPNQPAIPSANGDRQENPFGDRNDDALDQLRGNQADDPVDDAGRQPGRDENGDLLPGAEGRVTLDDFNRINDRDGDGLNDGVENRVDLGGERAPDAGDGGVDIVVDPVRQADVPPGQGDGGVLLGDGLSVVAEPDAPHPEGPRIEPAPPPPTGAIDPRADQRDMPPPLTDAVELRAEPAEVAPPANLLPGYEGPVAAGPPAANAEPAYQPPSHEQPATFGAAGTAADPVQTPTALDTFDTGTAPSNTLPASVETARSESATPSPAADDRGAAGETDATAPEAVVGGDYPLDADGDAGGTADADAPPALVGAPLSATDVFDAETIGAATTAAVAEAKDEGGGNLLERIFDKVKDALLDSGGSSPSPVQLPVQTEAAVPELPAADAVVTADEQFIQVDSDEASDTDDDDDLDDGL